MSKLEDSLNKIAENIRHLDDGVLMAVVGDVQNENGELLPHARMEKSVIIFAIINAVRVKKRHLQRRNAQKRKRRAARPPRPTNRTNRTNHPATG